MRPIAPRWRICREIRTRSGIATRDVPNPMFPGSDSFGLHAPDAETAIANAKTLGIAGRLIAIPEGN